MVASPKQHKPVIPGAVECKSAPQCNSVTKHHHGRVLSKQKSVGCFQLGVE